MCTCINFKTKNNYFGRNMDLEYSFGEKVVVTPQKYKFDLVNGNRMYTKYAIIGMATVVNGYPLYADACNEKGLAMAGLNFPGNAHFNKVDKDKLNLASYELIPFFLGNFTTVQEIKEIAKNLNITDNWFDNSMPVAQLHWMISDDKDCIVIEQCKNGLQVYDNQVGVLTNNPPFEYQLMHINNYMNVTASTVENRFSNKLALTPYGLGMGAIGLPGDNSPESRFVRAAFNKLNSDCNGDEECSVTQFFHILDSVSVIQGTITKDDKKYMTTYYSCINITKGIYYYKTYNNNQISAIVLNNQKYSNGLTIYNLLDKQQIRYEI